MSTIVLYASSRPKGNTHTIADYLATSLQAPKVDLSELAIAYYNYDGQYPEQDQFSTLITQALAYDKWLLVTPVYWYTMSAQMKTFLDRLSDRLSDQDDFRPKLAKKQLWVVACGSDSEPVPHFFTPFRLSAEYLDMTYGGDLHAWLGRVTDMKPEVKVLLDEFVSQVK